MDEYVILRATRERSDKSETCLISVVEYNGTPDDYFTFGWDKCEEVGRIEIMGDVEWLALKYTEKP